MDSLHVSRLNWAHVIWRKLLNLSVGIVLLRQTEDGSTKWNAYRVGSLTVAKENQIQQAGIILLYIVWYHFFALHGKLYL